MKIAVDTNVLVRAAVRDDPTQGDVAAALLTDAESIAIAVPCLCEFVWIPRKVYGFQPADAATAIRALLATANVDMNRPAVEAGLAMLEAGEISPMAPSHTKASGWAPKPSYPSTKRQSHSSRRKGRRRGFSSVVRPTA